MNTYKIAAEQPIQQCLKDRETKAVYVLIDYGDGEYALRYEMQDGTHLISDRGTWVNGYWTDAQIATDEFFNTCAS